MLLFHIAPVDGSVTPSDFKMAQLIGPHIFTLLIIVPSFKENFVKQSILVMVNILHEVIPCPRVL